MGCKDLGKPLREIGDTISFKLDARQPANIKPLGILLKSGATLASAKQGRYPNLKCEFIIKYSQELLRLGFVKNVSSPERVSAPLIVPKRPRPCITLPSTTAR